MKSPFYNQKFSTMISYFLLAIAVIVAYKFIMSIDVFFSSINWFLGVISPFIVGLAVAYVLNIPCGGIRKFLSKSKNKFIYDKRKILSIIMVYVLSLLVVFLIFRLIIPSLYESISIFVSNFSRYYESAQKYMNYINDLEILNFDISLDKILYSVQEFVLQKLPSSINALFNVSLGIINTFLALITSFYILLEKENIKKYFGRLIRIFLPKSIYSTSMKYVGNLNFNFKQYIYTQTIDGCILGTIATIELFFLKSPYALVLGVMLGIVNYIPYFGSIFGSIFVVLIVLFTQNIMIALIAAVVLLVTQQIDANIIQPRLMSGSFSLSPLLVIISITIGGAFYGVLGMIAAIPIVAVVKDILEEVIVYYEKRKNLEDEEK